VAECGDIKEFDFQDHQNQFQASLVTEDEQSPMPKEFDCTVFGTFSA
jgi:hypothetical protein